MIKLTRQTRQGWKTYEYKDAKNLQAGRPSSVRNAHLNEIEKPNVPVDEEQINEQDEEINKKKKGNNDDNNNNNEDKEKMKKKKGDNEDKDEKEIEEDGKEWSQLEESGKTKAKSLRHFLIKIGMLEKKVEKMSDSEVQKLASQKRKEMGKVKIEEVEKEWSALSPEEKKKRQAGWQKDIKSDKKKKEAKGKKFLVKDEWKRMAEEVILKAFEAVFEEKAEKTSENEGGAKDKWTVKDFADQAEEWKKAFGADYDDKKLQASIDKATEIAKKSTESAPGKATRAEVLGIVQGFFQKK